MQNHSKQVEYVYAGFWIRFAAYMLDFVIVMIALGIINSFLGSLMMLVEDTPLGGAVLFQYTLTDIFEYILTAVYFVLMTYFHGATLGKKILKLKVVSVKEDGKLRFFDVIYRETIGRFLSDIFQGLGYLTVAFTDEKKGIHDMLCGTRVIAVKKERLVYQGNVPAEEGEEGSVVYNEETILPYTKEESQEEEMSSIQADITEQWNRILNPQKEETTPQTEEQNIEGES